jgi:signal transduction histidine kinase
MAAVYPDPAYRDEVRKFMESLDGWRDLQLVARDGSVVPSAWANIRLGDDRQVGIGVDLTARKKLEDEVRDAYVHTRRALKERDAVLAVVSHDLRNPLSTVMMAASLLQADIPEDRKQKQAGIIYRAATQMKRLVDDLLEVARLEGGSYSLSCAPCSPADLVDAAVDAMLPLAESHGIALLVETGAMHETHVQADGERVLQVLTNLVGNAITHTPDGGRIVVRTLPQEGCVRFQVADTGVGIEPAHLPHVFDRFWQARRGNRAGAGLGLAIVKGIVEAHGGQVMVASTPGVGSTFEFTLPSV